MDTNLPIELSARVKFSDVTKWFEKIESAKSNKEKGSLFQKFIANIKTLQKKFKEDEPANANSSAYPILRLFLPKLDTERGSYGLQMKTLGRLFVKTLALGPQSEDAKKLTLQGMASTVDYGNLVYSVMEHRSPASSSLMVSDVNKYLDLMADHFKQNERSKIDTEMIQMLAKMSAIDCKWLTRIILEKLKLGIGDKHILQLYHKDADDFYNQYSHLSNMVEAVESGKTIDENLRTMIALFKPVRPMLCERGQITQIENMLQKHEYYLETKMDGERFHIHINGNEFKYFSRSCNEDFTKHFGSNSTSGNYSPRLKQVLNEKVTNAILDGEMMVWDREDQLFHTKSEQQTARHLSADDPRLKACFVIYDILYLNDKCLINIPYDERQRVMRTTLAEYPGTFVFCAQEKLRDAEHFIELMNEAFDANEEGVVIKQTSSIYRPGKRDKGGWYKIKPDYTNNLITDFDLLILGANKDETQTRFISFLLGVFKKDNNSNDSGVFHAVCSVRNGFSRDQFRGICQQLEPHWKKPKERRSSGASCIEWNRAQPDVWIEPKHSIVLQIKGSELAETHTFRTSHSIRFARCIAIRRDKPWYDTCTLDEFQQLCSSNSKVEKLTKRHVTADDMIGSAAGSLSKRVKKTAGHQSTYFQASISDIGAVDTICEGLDFCILSGDKTNSINALKTMVIRHGGRIVENPGPKTFICIAGELNERVKNLENSKKYSIASTKWLFRALGSEKPLARLKPFGPKDMRCITNELSQKFMNEYDIYGDSFTENFETEAELLEFLNEMRIESVPQLITSELNDIEVELNDDNGNHTVNMFRLCIAYFYQDDVTNLNKDFELSKYILRTEAGKCLQTVNDVIASDSTLTHIFVRDTNFDSAKLKEIVNECGIENTSSLKILRCQWILDCYRANWKICDDDYRISIEID